MLVLGRRCGETIRIGDGVRITVLSAGGGQIRLGIDAPDHVSVHREEVWERIASANVDAMNALNETIQDSESDAESVENEE